MLRSKAPSTSSQSAYFLQQSPGAQSSCIVEYVGASTLYKYITNTGYKINVFYVSYLLFERVIHIVLH